MNLHNNTVAVEGCTRCVCGCKYWENDRCVDCGRLAAVSEDASPEQQEADRVYAFCLSGLGHRNVTVERPDYEVGLFGETAYCEDCGTDLTDAPLYDAAGAR